MKRIKFFAMAMTLIMLLNIVAPTAFAISENLNNTNATRISNSITFNPLFSYFIDCFIIYSFFIAVNWNDFRKKVQEKACTFFC